MQAVYALVEASDVGGAAGPTWWQVVPVAALVSAAVTIALRWFDRPRAVMQAEGRLSMGRLEATSEGQIQLPLALINCGDGPAYDVRVYGSGCDVATESVDIGSDGNHWTYRIPVLAGGTAARLTVSVLEDFTGDETLFVTWAPRPQRWFRKRYRVRLTEVSRESLFPPGILPLSHIPARTRRTRRLEALSLRARHSQPPGRAPDPTPER